MLSCLATIVFENSELPSQLCKIVGEFSNSDTHQLPGELYYQLEENSVTYVGKQGDSILAHLGDNRLIHVYKVRSRTVCSIVTEYQHTNIICHGWFSEIYKMQMVMPTKKNSKKRFYPIRTNYEHAQEYFKIYLKMKFKPINDEMIVKTRGRNFILSIREE